MNSILLADGNVVETLLKDCQASSHSFLSIFAGWAIHLVEVLGAIGVVLATALETIFPFIPSEIVLPLVGATAKLDATFNLPFAILWATLGATLGAVALYYLSYLVGIERIKWLFSKIPLVNEEDIEKANNWFDKFGFVGVLIGRFIPVVRVLISIPAGLNKMKIGWFIFYTALGSLIWNSALIIAGYFAASQWCHIEDFTKNFTVAAIIIILILIILYIVHIVIRSKKKSNIK